VAVRRLVERLADDLPRRGDVLDVGNGLAEQDPLIAATARTRSLTALNVTLSQLRAGRPRLDEAGAHGVNGDATRMPFTDASFDGVISVEAAFHFGSRDRFFADAFRVLRPGGVLTMSDIPTNRYPRGPREGFAALTQLRVWGLHVNAAASAGVIIASAERAGFVDVRTERVGDRTIGPALRFVRGRLEREKGGLPATYELGARFMLAQVDLLWRRGIIDYLLLRATKPG
jgi:SAM-dependent methyltransferase